jgi:hypothetical protein
MRLTIFFLDTAGDKISRENELADGVAIAVQASVLSGHNYTITVLTSVINGFVEILKETINRSWGLQHIVLPPPPLGHPL